ncbi:hypothetical protein N9D23_07745, partial [Rubripirellula sp.]|nr:hypothetical protein [Rubripirellula sp.]
MRSIELVESPGVVPSSGLLYERTLTEDNRSTISGESGADDVKPIAAIQAINDRPATAGLNRRSSSLRL